MSGYEISRLEIRVSTLERERTGGFFALLVLVLGCIVLWCLVTYLGPQRRQAADGRQFLCWTQDFAYPWESQPKTLLSCVVVDHVARVD